jgi:2-polyprenyl-3-methyl-5-hydroxy-6-metoxy-1,4-benzoquinol methylase
MISDQYFDSFHTAKYHRRSAVQRLLVRRFVARLEVLVNRAAPFGTALEIGCGEGFLTGHLAQRHPDARFVGIDTSESDLSRLRAKFPGVEGRAGSAYDLASLGERFDLVIAAEVLEHLERPERALEQIVRLGPRHLVASVPHEPWFRLGNLARGKNVRRLGNDPEHVQHWGPRSFRALLERHMHVVALERSFPWLLALARPR